MNIADDPVGEADPSVDAMRASWWSVVTSCDNVISNIVLRVSLLTLKVLRSVANLVRRFGRVEVNQHLLASVFYVPDRRRVARKPHVGHGSKIFPYYRDQ